MSWSGGFTAEPETTIEALFEPLAKEIVVLWLPADCGLYVTVSVPPEVPKEVVEMLKFVLSVFETLIFAERPVPVTVMLFEEVVPTVVELNVAVVGLSEMPVSTPSERSKVFLVEALFETETVAVCDLYPLLLT